MKTVVDNKFLRVLVSETDSNYATLCFTGVGHAFGGIDVQTEEFRRSSQRSTSIYVIDKQRSWGNYIDFLELFRLIRPFLRGKTINALGNSMGGYIAILASQFIEMSVVVTFVPQYSVSKQIIPDEFRWDRYVNEIREWKYLSLQDSFNPGTRYYIIAGAGGDDDRHLKLFPKSSNIQRIFFTESKFDHDVAKILKEDEVLYDLIYDCFSGAAAQDISETYERKMNYEIRHEISDS
jgi:hypothetical protein